MMQLSQWGRCQRLHQGVLNGFAPSRAAALIRVMDLSLDFSTINLQQICAPLLGTLSPQMCNKSLTSSCLHAGGGGYGQADDSMKQNGEGPPPCKKRRVDYSAVAHVSGSVARYKANQESA